MNYLHNPVMIEKVIQGLNIISGGTYVDCTFGRGGHSKNILDLIGENGKLIAIDKDSEAENHARTYFSNDNRFSFERNNFSQITKILEKYNKSEKINGVLLDLGVSSPQIDNPERGFSFQKSGPLDMRMDTNINMTALSWLKKANIDEIKDVLKTYGEEKYAFQIANSIKQAIDRNMLSTTTDLAKLIQNCYPKNNKFRKNPATKSFQAIRIFINKELDELEKILEACLKIIVSGGRIVVISFHSLEDRMVKKFINKYSIGDDVPSKMPILNNSHNLLLKKIKIPVKASEDEINANIRARSARLRVAEII
mgnify:FL=1